MLSKVTCLFIGFVAQATTVSSFVSSSTAALSSPLKEIKTDKLQSSALMMEKQPYEGQHDNGNNKDGPSVSSSRRSFLASSIVGPASAAFFVVSNSALQPAWAESEEDTNEATVQTPLYSILRVREATEQETRLIKSGKFKDVQRANVKLAVKFMLDNYRLNDNFIAASAYLAGDRKIKAADIGQTTVQNLITILEYFDSSDVENIKLGSSGLGGKETIVLNGLAAAKKGIDDFVALFPKDDVSAVVARIDKENELNRLEFDAELGNILNPKPTQS